MATINVRRATDRGATGRGRRQPLLGIGGVWFIGDSQVADAEGPLTKAVGIAILSGVPGDPADRTGARRRSGRGRATARCATYLIAVVYIAHVQGLGSLSTIEETSDPEKWAGSAPTS